MPKRAIDVKAVPTVNSCPCMMYTKNAETEIRIGASVHIIENRIELIRAESDCQ